MSKQNPDASRFEHLRELIRVEEQRTNQQASRVRISYEIAADLMGMEAEDWYAAGKGFSDMDYCTRLANDFLRCGIAAANGLSISVVGPILEVAEDQAAPPVEIAQGIP
ncbi:MAG: hypothetical protein WAW39_02205 [Prosthecobacter sp.]|uniref:hypothetical protein n=1 Tax=Prosthecobacter sp. TaxID=1965333 RepID=UPI003BB13957